MKFYAEIDLQNRIKPLWNRDYDILQKTKKNTPLRIEVIQERNYKFHKKVMALFNLGFENQEKIANFDHYRKIITMRAGYYDTVITEHGTVYFAQSISYANKDQKEFEDVFNRLLDVLYKDLGSDKETLRKEIENFM